MNNQNDGVLLRNITVLMGGTCSVLAAIMISPALPGMAEAFKDTADADFLVRLILTMPALFVAIGSPFIGGLLDRWGRKPVLMVSLIVFVLAGSAGFFLDTLALILVSRALLGLAVAGIMSGFMTLIIDYFEGKSLNRFLGLNGASVCLGGILGLVASGFLADIGWRYPFLIHLVGVLIFLGVVFFIDEPNESEKKNSKTLGGVGLPYKKLAPVYATAFMCTLLFFIFPAQLPFYLVAGNDINSSQVGMALALPTIVGLIFALLYKRINDLLSFKAIASVIFMSYAINHLVVSISSDYAVVIFGLLFGGIGMGLLSPNNSSWLASLTPVEVRGRAVGLLTSCIFLGQFFSPIVTQPFVSSVGLNDTFALMALASLLITFVFSFPLIKTNWKRRKLIRHSVIFKSGKSAETLD